MGTQKFETKSDDGKISVKDTIESLVGEVRKTKESLDKKIAAGEGGRAELETKIEKLNSAIDGFEAKNQDLIQRIEAEKSEKSALNDQIKDLESKIIRLGSASGESLQTKTELKMLTDFAVGGRDLVLKNFGAPETKDYLRSDSNVQGGFLMSQSYDDMILKPITEISALRPYCKVKRIEALSERMARRGSLVTSVWTGEGESKTTSSSTYQQPEIHVHKMTTKTLITEEALLGARFDMENEIMSDFIESAAQLEGYAFVNGDGVKKPRGFLDATAGGVGLTRVDGSGSSTYTFDDLIALTGQLKTGYNPMYGMNRTELAFMRTLKSDAGEYIWQSGNLGAGVPNAINGRSYVEIPDMPNKATNATPIVFADFRKMYCIVDAFNSLFFRNPYSDDDEGKIKFTMRSFVGGDVIEPEAGVLLKTIA